MIKVGIDQSFTSTGICVIENNNKLLNHYLITSDSSQSIYNRAIFLANDILKSIKEFNIECVNIEGLSFASRGDATRNLAGLQFLVIDRLIRENIPYEIIPPQSLKKFVLKGGMKKEEMFELLPSDIYEIFNKYNKSKKYDLMDAYYLGTYYKT